MLQYVMDGAMSQDSSAAAAAAFYSSPNVDDDTDDAALWASYYSVLWYAVLMSIVVMASKFLHDHAHDWIGALLPEAGLVILCGMIAGGMIHLYELYVVESSSDAGSASASAVASLLNFSPDVFFVGLLPPIIFNSGYHLRRELFVRHFSPICLFAILGTAISAVCIAGTLYLVVVVLGWVSSSDEASFQPTLAELLTFGALVSATDPVSTLAVFQEKRVDPQLFYLVFGESVLNDAMGLVLFQEFAKLLVPAASQDEQKSAWELCQSFCWSFSWLALASPIMGILCGVALAFLFQYMGMRHGNHVVLELSLYVFVLHVPYLLGQIVGLSGIVVILFTGMAAKQYVEPNLSEATAVSADLIFRLVAYLAETAIFLQLGLSVFGLSGSFHGMFIVWALIACLIGRAFNVYPLTVFHNWTIQRQHGVDKPFADDMQDQSDRLDKAREREIDNEEDDNEFVATESTTLLNDANDEVDPPSRRNLLSAKTRNRLLYMSVRTPVERGDLKILPNCAHMLWFAGLRGAVAYACVRTFPNVNGNRDSFVMTTMMIVLVTVFGLGATTTQVLNYLDIETNIDEDVYMDSWSQERSMPSFIVKIEKFIEQHAIRHRNETKTSASSSMQEQLDELDRLPVARLNDADGVVAGIDRSGGSNDNGRRSERRTSFLDGGLRRSSVSITDSMRRPDQYGIYDSGRSETRQ